MKKDKLIKTEQNLLSPRSTNYLLPLAKLPYYTAKQESLIDFIFSKLHQLINTTMSSEEKAMVVRENFNEAIIGAKTLPPDFRWMAFESSEVRKVLGRYEEMQMLNDLRQLREKEIIIKGQKVWVDEKGKYESVVNCYVGILNSVHEVKTTKIAPRTGTPIHTFNLSLSLAIGVLWSNDSIRKNYSLFPKSFYNLPEQCQKIYRYISLFKKRFVYLHHFQNILNYKPTKNLSDQKKLIEGYLNILKKTEKFPGHKYIVSWKRVKGSKGLETQWLIKRSV